MHEPRRHASARERTTTHQATPAGPQRQQLQTVQQIQSLIRVPAGGAVWCLLRPSRTAPSPAQKAGEYPLSLKQIVLCRRYSSTHHPPPSPISFPGVAPHHISDRHAHDESSDGGFERVAALASSLLAPVALGGRVRRSRARTHPISHRRRRGRRRRAPLPAAPSSPAACGG